jgi:cell division protein FtsL
MDQVKNLTHAYSQAPWRKQLQLIGLFSLLVVFLALVAMIYLNVTARATTIGREILNMQADIDELKLQNAHLETQLGILTSSNEMKSRALEMGFQSIELGQAEYIVVTGYVPRQQAVLAPPEEPVTTVAASLPPNFTASLMDWLVDNALPKAERMMEALP